MLAIASVRITRFLRTTAFRLALIYAGIFSLSVILLFAFIFWTTSVLVDRQRQQAIVLTGPRNPEFDDGVSTFDESLLAQSPAEARHLCCVW